MDSDDDERPSPREFVRKRAKKNGDNNVGDMFRLLQAQMVQDQKKVEAERKDRMERMEAEQWRYEAYRRERLDKWEREQEMMRKAAEEKEEIEPQRHQELMELTRRRNGKEDRDRAERREQDDRRHAQLMQVLVALRGGSEENDSQSNLLSSKHIVRCDADVRQIVAQYLLEPYTRCSPVEEKNILEDQSSFASCLKFQAILASRKCGLEGAHPPFSCLASSSCLSVEP